MADNLSTGNTSTTFERSNSFKDDDKNKPKSYSEIRAERAAKGTTVVKTKKKESWWRSLLVAALIAFFIRTFFIEAFRIPTGSMKNTLLVGDYLFVNKIGYFLSSPKYLPFTTIEIPYFRIKTGSIHRGDVVVFEYPGDRDLVVPREKKINYIKRCIGEPGDNIQIINKQVFVNGKLFTNPPESILQPDTARKGDVDPGIFPRGGQWNKDNFGPLHVPKKGDIIAVNQANLAQWEVFIEREGHKAQLGNNGVEIDGKPVTEYKVERDYLWMMGDNRDNSEDSRFWGFAPVDNVVGDAMFIYWSWYHPPTDGTEDGYDPDEVQKTHVRWDRIGRIIH